MAACCYKQNNDVIWFKRAVHAFFGTRKACIFVWDNALAPIKPLHQSSFLSVLPLSLCTHRFLLAHLRSASGISSGSRPLSQLLHLTPFQGAQRKFQRPLWWYLPECRDAAVGLNCCCSCTSGMRETLTVFTRWRTKHADDLSLQHCVWLWKSYHNFSSTVFTPPIETMAIQAVTQAQQRWQIQLAATSMAWKDPTENLWKTVLKVAGPGLCR